MNFGDIKRIHFVGIGGIGMSGIAEILTNYALAISGCDAKESPITRRLAGLGVSVQVGHDAAHVTSDLDLVVISSAVRQDNDEVVRARELKVPVIRRAEMLGRIMGQKKSIGIAGTHGKTSTTAMTSMVLAEAGLDPTMIVGGVLRNLESNAKLGKGEHLVVEADEYDRSFLALDPTYVVITNIEADHLDCYKDLDDIRGAFRAFALKAAAHRAPIVGCLDDENVAELLRTLDAETVSYGLSDGADLRAVNIRYAPTGTTFDVSFRGKELGSATLNVPGDHNVRNALAAVAVGLELNVPFDVISRGLGGYRGVERRFQVLGDYQGAVVVDDYAHHPTEIRATLEAARRSYPDRRLVALFQPHLFTRTRDFYLDFAQALAMADVAFVTPIYAAREEPILGVTSALITDAAARAGSDNVHAINVSSDDLVATVSKHLEPSDLFVTMGAGDIHKVSEQLAGGAR